MTNKDTCRSQDYLICNSTSGHSLCLASGLAGGIKSKSGRLLFSVIGIQGLCLHAGSLTEYCGPGASLPSVCSSGPRSPVQRYLVPWGRSSHSHDSRLRIPETSDVTRPCVNTVANLAQRVQQMPLVPVFIPTLKLRVTAYQQSPLRPVSVSTTSKGLLASPLYDQCDLHLF
jgi:hypothetical protein